jgi:hypothetical protein
VSFGAPATGLEKSRRVKLPVKRTIAFVVLSIALLVSSSVPAFAKGPNKGIDPACVVVGNSVSTTALPTDQVINFMVTDATGTNGWVLGFTSDGTWDVTVPAQNGPTTYQFASRTWGPDGTKYNVFSSCSTPA